MRFGRTISALCLATLLLTGACARTRRAVIGVVVPLTGNYADYGQRMKRGIDLAMRELAAQGGADGIPVTVVYEDGQADPAKSVAAFNKLTTVDHVAAVLTGFSGVVLALAPVANQRHVPLLNCGATAPAIAKAGPFVFSIIPLATQEAAFMARFLAESLHEKEVVIYWQNNDAGDGMREAFRKEFEALGGRVLLELPNTPGAADFRADLAKIAKFPGVPIFCPTYARDLGVILKQAREMGLTSTFIGYAASEVPTLIRIAGDASEGLIYSYYSYDANSPRPEVRRFVEEYRLEYGEPPDLYAATFYDGATLLGRLVQAGHVEGDDIRQALLAVTHWEGVTGEITFGGKRIASVPITVKMVRHGRFESYTGVAPTGARTEDGRGHSEIAK